MKDFLQGRWLGHPLHSLLVHIPAALLPAAVVFDILSRLGLGGNAMVRTSFYAILVGVAVVFAAIPTGLADWWDIKDSNPARKIGLIHLSLNVLATVFFIGSLLLRLGPALEAEMVGLGPFGLALVGALVLLLSSYLGHRLTYGYGISVARLSKGKWRRIAQSGQARLP